MLLVSYSGPDVTVIVLVNAGLLQMVFVLCILLLKRKIHYIMFGIVSSIRVGTREQAVIFYVHRSVHPNYIYI
jgi:hypothetical protein